ncbi:tripartite tricarboxylate transporter substrate binding protein [Variovorax sp. J22R133]|uniref:tripartite tricarboxylate transporter substrate binding protein n=1 Tax=Variovorax brevis TaxID=3053503 RepID=UPI002577BAC3|nr:tripartite tricarboxylate transporter substrate binding protein [Variovorax sp. J22R133]MDM0112736.1 tripartite tricarboxylate transporter substrate binding protein [Variovorax sp. J22R133]
MTRFKKLGALLTALVLTAGAAHAQMGKQINLMVPYPAGGPSDSAARIVSTPLGTALKEQVIVENLGGASGSIAAQKVLAAPADGRYIFQGSPNEVILAALANAAIKIKAEDFRLVHPMTDATMVFVARKDLPANNVDELIALARKSTDKPLSYGSVGIGSLYHFILEDVQKRTNIKLSHVPYKGNAPLLQDLGGGQVDFAVLVYSSAMGALAEQGRLKIIGQLGATRSPFLKDVATAAEGKELPKFEYKIWSGFFVPKATPDAIVDKLHAGIQATLKDESVRSQLAVQMQTASPQMSVAEAAKFFEAEAARYRAIAKAINLQPQ